MSAKQRTLQVHVGSILYDYTDGQATVEACGKDLVSLLADLERRHPGLRFRVVDEQDQVRPHIHLFVGGRPVRDLSGPLGEATEVHILGALSGG